VVRFVTLMHFASLTMVHFLLYIVIIGGSLGLGLSMAKWQKSFKEHSFANS